MKELKSDKYHDYCLLLFSMCSEIGMSPSFYLFNDLECAHTRQVVDLTIYQVFCDWRERERKRSERKASLGNAY